jgi:phenylalanyl-tRNA synthetase beta subunit
MLGCDLKKITFLLNEKDKRIDFSFSESGKVVGFLSEEVIKGKKNNSVFNFQLSLTKVFDYLSNNRKNFFCKDVSNFPTSEKDITIELPEEEEYNKVIQTVENNFKKDIYKVNLIDVYRNDKMKEKKVKSVTFRIIFQSDKETLRKE